MIVRRDDDLGRPTLVQAFVFTLVFYLTLAATGLLLLIALFTVRHRTLHDLASGLVVVRAQALTRALGSWNMQGGSPTHEFQATAPPAILLHDRAACPAPMWRAGRSARS